MTLLARHSAFGFLTAALCTLFCFSAAAQENFVEGYIVKTDHDSLRGQIDYRDWSVNPGHIVFLDASTGIKRVFGTSDLLAFGVKNERYESHPVHIRPYSIRPEELTNQEEVGNPYDTTLFLQVLTSGKLSLWELRQASGANYFFITGKEGGPDQLLVITQIVSADGTTKFDQQEVFKDQLAALMSDCKTLHGRIGRTEYRESPLRSLVFSYNHCGTDTAIEGRQEHHGAEIRFFPIAGFMTSKITVAGSNDPAVSQQWPSSSSVVAGAGALLLLPRSRQQFSFVADLAWQRWHSESNTIVINSFTNATGHIDYSLLQLDLLFRYRYPSGKLRPFLEAGMANAMALTMNCYQRNSNPTDGTHYDEPLLGGALNHYQQGWILGAGVGGRHWSLEGRWETSQGISQSLNTSSRTNTVYLLASFPL